MIPRSMGVTTSGPKRRAPRGVVKSVAPVDTGWGTHKTGNGGFLDPRSSISTHRDPRYGTARWQKLRLRILDRDNWVCRVVLGCPVRASVADHIVPVTAGMADVDFFDPNNLRASCRGHNLDRAAVDRLKPNAAVVTKDYT